MDGRQEDFEGSYDAPVARGWGLPYVVPAHHRATRSFRYEGNAIHDAGKQQKGITLEEWQRAIKERHRVGSSGMEDGQQAESVDCKAKAG